MADEPRRSVRATKGQHTKIDLLDQPVEPKKKASKKSKKAAEKEEEEEEEIIRCVCGAIEQGDDEGEPWIACDNCGVWQHNVCVGISPYSDDIPEDYNYLCEECGPEFHKPLLEGIQNGQKLWEERRRVYEKEKLEEEQGKKKGKKKGKRTSDPKSELGNTANGKAKSPSTPVVAEKKEKKETVARAGSTKRKARDESQDKDAAKEPQSKVRKVSALHSTPRQVESPPRVLPVKLIDVDSTRQGAVTLLLKGLQASIPIAIQNGVYVLSKDDTIDSKAERVAIEIEDAVHQTHPSKGAANQQNRAIAANLKRNQELCNGLLTKALTPGALAVMTSDDMASKEQKRETAEMKARADKQSIMVTDDGPRMRRTHKGDEVIEGDNFAIPNDSTMSTSRRRSMMDPNAEMATRSRENSPGNEVELPASIDDYRSQDNIRSNVIPKQPLNIDTKPPPVRKASTQDFDINKVFSSVQSPVSAHHNRRPSGVIAPPSSNRQERDPDIDKLLADDEGNESPPYSPAEYNSDPDIIWRGTVTMDSIARFPAVAKHVGGADLSAKIPWSNILQKDLRVAGRIDQEKANVYLCNLRYNQGTDVVVVIISPTGEAASQGFQELYQYFQSRGKYGVLTNKGVGNVRDTYLIPIPPSPASLPDFLTNLEGQEVPENNRNEPAILVTLVIRGEWQPAENPQSSNGSNDAQSPSMVGHPQRQMSISGTGPAMSPIAPQGAFAAPPSSEQAAHPQLPADRQQQEDERLRLQRDGEEVANRILGEYSQAPTVHFLMPQAWQMRSIEWELIKGILTEDERARNDLAHLSVLLEAKMVEQDKS